MTETARPIGSFRLDLPAPDIARADATRIRTLATWACIRLMPGYAFLRQRSEFIQGWELAADAGGALTGGVSAGAVGEAGRPAIGSWMMLPDLAGPSTQTVLPSTDTLYGMALLELDRQGPVVLGVPDPLPDGRYWSVGVMDAELHNVAHVGPRWTGPHGGEHLLAGPGWEGEKPAWAASIIRVPTRSACLYARVLVGYEQGDLDRVRTWREGFTLTTLAERLGRASPVIETADLVHGDLRTLTDPFAFLRLGFAHLERNPPPRTDAWLLALLRSGGFDAIEDDERRAAVCAGFDDAQLILDGAISGEPRRDGWTVPFRHTAELGPWVLEHAAIELRAIGANDRLEAIYQFADRDAEGTPLDAGDGSAYELHLAADALPPLEDGGFWSLTMYRTSDSLLVHNPLERYATRLERPGFERGPDGSATVVMAAERPADVPEANWLPAPPAEPFQVGLRLYYPGPEILDGSWFPPAVRRRGAQAL